MYVSAIDPKGLCQYFASVSFYCPTFPGIINLLSLTNTLVTAA